MIGTAQKIVLDEPQKAALRWAVDNGLSLLTGLGATDHEHYTTLRDMAAMADLVERVTVRVSY